VKPGRRLLLAPKAAADLEEIAEYIARDNPARAASFVAELQAKCQTIFAAPKIFPARSDLAPGLRMAVHGRYLVFFRECRGQNAVRIERVLHGARRLPGQFP
jgi:toxin ParE1/3/4